MIVERQPTTRREQQPEPTSRLGGSHSSRIDLDKLPCRSCEREHWCALKGLACDSFAAYEMGRTVKSLAKIPRGRNLRALDGLELG